MANSGYWDNIKTIFVTSVKGLKTTFQHLTEANSSARPMAVSDPEYFKQDKGLMTLQYPHESFPVPDNGRYKLDNEIDDCIVCDKCAKVCPVDCIDIEPVKATETIGYTSDGTPKRIHAAKFDIDMSKCCFCGLCTTVCPTECLTMTKTYDFSAFDVAEHTYEYATMTPLEILQKKKELEEFENKKREAKSSVEVDKDTAETKRAIIPKRPTIKPLVKGEDSNVAAKPKFKPRPMVRRKKKDDE